MSAAPSRATNRATATAPEIELKDRPGPRHRRNRGPIQVQDRSAATAGPWPVGRLIALVPAHNEEAQIEATVRSLQQQDRAPEAIVVVCDNCTDRTPQLAAALGVRVVETQGNRYRKAGALNQALDQLLPHLDPQDAVLVMDADSVLDHGFLATAVQRLSRNDVCAVGGTFTGQPGGGLVGMFQRNEYARYARDVARLKGKVLVLTGTATVFRVGALLEVRQARADGQLPGAEDQVYDTKVLTEDNELTLALLHLGYRIISPLGCRLTTEVMQSWGDLARQRLRWKRGALENLFDYGWTPVTRSYWGRQFLSLLGAFVTFVYLGSVIWALGIDGGLHLQPLWLAVTAVFSLERVVTVHRRGWKQMLLSAVLVIEMLFDVYLQAVQMKAVADALLARERRW